MENKLNDMVKWERQKAIFIMSVAEKLGMDLSSYGQLAVNPNSGYTYLWLDDYNFSLYMPIDCELVKTDIVALWSCPECGEEIETTLKQSDNLNDISERINDIERKHFQDSHPEQLENEQI